MSCKLHKYHHCLDFYLKLYVLMIFFERFGAQKQELP